MFEIENLILESEPLIEKGCFVLKFPINSDADIDISINNQIYSSKDINKIEKNKIVMKSYVEFSNQDNITIIYYKKEE